MKKIWNMKNNLTLKTISFTFITSLLFACNPDSPGVEYMPDMYRSPAIEPYVDNSEYGNTEIQSVRLPVEGTIPRGYNPYTYENSPEGFELAGAELKNPLEVNDKNFEDGKVLYVMLCKHCHGKKGDGKGSITHPVYGAVPSYSDATKNRRGDRAMNDLKAGHIYHTIIYGLNAMGPHASQINEEERWKIVMYVQSLQGNKIETETSEKIEVEETALTN